MQIIPFLRLIRFPNLLIVAATQYLVYYHLLLTSFGRFNLSGFFDSFYFFIFLITTLLITSSGYIINDIYDIGTDKLNRPEKRIIDVHINSQTAWFLYLFTLSVGAILALFIAINRTQFIYWFLYPTVIFLLFAYSRWIKGIPLLGNIVVSLFCAGVPGIFFLTEQSNLENLKLINPPYFFLIEKIGLSYILFAFLSNFYREIVKDLQDETGDRLTNINTAAVSWGIKKTKYFAISIAIITSLIIFYVFGFSLSNEFNHLFLIQFFIIQLPLFVSLYKLSNANDALAFRNVGLWIKFVMINGLILMAYITYQLYELS